MRCFACLEKIELQEEKYLILDSIPFHESCVQGTTRSTCPNCKQMVFVNVGTKIWCYAQGKTHHFGYLFSSDEVNEYYVKTETVK